MILAETLSDASVILSPWDVFGIGAAAGASAATFIAFQVWHLIYRAFPRTTPRWHPLRGAGRAYARLLRDIRRAVVTGRWT